MAVRAAVNAATGEGDGHDGSRYPFLLWRRRPHIDEINIYCALISYFGLGLSLLVFIVFYGKCGIKRWENYHRRASEETGFIKSSENAKYARHDGNKFMEYANGQETCFGKTARDRRQNGRPQELDAGPGSKRSRSARKNGQGIRTFGPGPFR